MSLAFVIPLLLLVLIGGVALGRRIERPKELQPMPVHCRLNCWNIWNGCSSGLCEPCCRARQCGCGLADSMRGLLEAKR